MGFLSTVIDTVARALTTAHIADTNGAHAASAIANTPAGGIAATDVQAALNELDAEKAPLAGNVTGADAAAGDVGEFIESVVTSGSAVSLTTGTATNVTTLSLSAGDWDVYGSGAFLTAATTSVSRVQVSISTTSATNGADTAQITFPGGSVINTGANGSPRLAAPSLRVNSATPITVYLVALSGFTVSTCSAYGKIWARRRR